METGMETPCRKDPVGIRTRDFLLRGKSTTKQNSLVKNFSQSGKKATPPCSPCGQTFYIFGTNDIKSNNFNNRCYSTVIKKKAAHKLCRKWDPLRP